MFRSLVGPREGSDEAIFDFFPCFGDPGNAWDPRHSNPTHLWAPKKGTLLEPLLILSLLPGTPENREVTWQFCPFVAPQEGRGDIANSIMLLGSSRDPRDRMCCGNCAHL